LFHGTLLWDTDPEAMRRALAGDASQRGRKVASVPSPTVNLRTLTGRDDTAAEFMEKLADALEE
jgi:lipoate-protein ligase A